MNIHPNQTLVNAVIQRVVAAHDGVGHELDLEILTNESPDPNADFLKPQSGDRIKVFVSDRGELKDGQKIRATLKLMGGPFQERAVLLKADHIPIKP